MGYRSSVYINITYDKFPELMSILHAHDLTDSFTITADESLVSLQADELKWYDSFPEVVAVNAFIASSDEHAGMIVVGEDKSTTYYGFTDAVNLDAYAVVEGVMTGTDLKFLTTFPEYSI